MRGGSAGGRVLVVASTNRGADRGRSSVDGRRGGETVDDGGPTNDETPGKSGNEGEADSAEHDSFVRGGGSESRNGTHRYGNDDAGRRSARDVDPPPIVSKLEELLDAEVIVRLGATATEYVEELGPTLDCVVVLGENTNLVRTIIKDGTVPIVVYDPPRIATVDGYVAESDVADELADRIQSEIHEDRAESKLQESNARLTALSLYAEDITACETVDAVVRRTVEATTEALAFEFCVVLLAEGDEFVSRASTLSDPEFSSIQTDEGIAGRTLRTGESKIVDDIQSDPDAVIKHDDLHAGLSVPIGDWGVIQVASNRHGAFDERDREFVEILAGYTREALERIEREVALREERDRLHAFFYVLPAPAICVERVDGVPKVADVNTAYSSRFGDVEGGSPLSSVIPTDAELDRFEATFNGCDGSTETVERPMADGTVGEFTLTVVPASPPGTRECAYGIYHEWSE